MLWLKCHFCNNVRKVEVNTAEEKNCGCEADPQVTPSPYEIIAKLQSGDVELRVEASKLKDQLEIYKGIVKRQNLEADTCRKLHFKVNRFIFWLAGEIGFDHYTMLMIKFETADPHNPKTTPKDL